MPIYCDGNVTVGGTLTPEADINSQRGSTKRWNAANYEAFPATPSSGDPSVNGEDVTFITSYSYPYQDMWTPTQINVQLQGNSAARYSAIVYVYSGYYTPYGVASVVAEFNGMGSTLDGVTYSMTSGASNYAARKLSVILAINSSHKWDQMEGGIGWHTGFRYH